MLQGREQANGLAARRYLALLSRKGSSMQESRSSCLIAVFAREALISKGQLASSMVFPSALMIMDFCHDRQRSR